MLNHKLTYYHLKWAVKSPGHLNYCDTKTLVDSVYDVWSKEQTERLSALSEICRGYEWYDGVKRARCSLKLRTKKRVTDASIKKLLKENSSTGETNKDPVIKC